MNFKDPFGLGVQALLRLNAKFKPQTSTQMKSVVAALYLAENDQVLKYANLVGLLQLDMDRKLKTKFLRLYNMDTMKLAFQIQLYYDFANQYRKLDDKFYYFDYPVGTIGFLFRNKLDADMMLAKIRSEAPTLKDQQEFIAQIRAKQRKQQQANSLFGRFKKKFMSKQDQISERGQVLKFQKIYVTKVSADGQYISQGKSPFEIDILQRLNLTDKQKKNPEIMNMITTNLIIHQMKQQMMQNPQQQMIDIIKQHQKQQNQYIQDCRRTVLFNLPPPPPPPPLLSPLNRVSLNKNTRNNLMDEIKNNNIKLKHVQTNEKGGINIDLSTMNTVDRDDFATALRKKIALRKKALNKYQNSSDQQK